MEERPIWYDGALVAWDDARTNVLSHAMQRGSLVFDVGALREAPGGRRLLFRPREHIARFLRSASIIGLEIDADEESLLAATLQVARARVGAVGLVRWSAFVATPEADVVPRAGRRARVTIAVIAPGDYALPGEIAAQRPAVMRVAVPSDVRKAGPEVLPAQAKVAAAYLGPMLAKRRALAEGFDEVVLLDGDGRLTEAPTANFFAVLAGELVTPPLDRVLAGITRDTVLTLARAEGIPVRERDLRLEDVAGAEEAFLTATSMPVQPIGSLAGRPLPAAPGPLTAHFQKAVAACERGLDARFPGWTLGV